MIDLKAIRAAAEAATPGPWIAAGPSFGEPLPKYINCVLVENEDGDADDVCIAPIGCDAISTKDLTFIATANPATVIALCDEIERLRKLLNPLSDAQIERMSAVGEPCADDWVHLSPWEYKRELERARAAGIRIAEQAHGITGGAE